MKTVRHVRKIMIQHMDTLGLGAEDVEKWETAQTMMDGVWIATR